MTVIDVLYSLPCWIVGGGIFPYILTYEKLDNSSESL